jgi:exopolysaccharide biosynthesis polyprenyl glycosylphosphotransferase
MNKPQGHELQAPPDAWSDNDPYVTSLERRRLRVFAVMLLCDIAVLHFAFSAAGLLYEGEWWQRRAMLGPQLLTPLFLTISLYNGAYSARVLTSLRYAARKVVMSLLIAAGLLNFIAFFLKANAEFSRVVFTLGLVSSLPMLIGLRWAVTRFVEQRWQGRIRNALILADGGPSFALDTALTIDTQRAGLVPARDDPLMFDRLGRILENQDRVIVSCPPEKRRDWAFLLKSAGVNGEIISDYAHSLGALGVRRYEALGRTSVQVSSGPLGLRARIAKRLFDVATASIALILLSPLMLMVALAIKLSDGGPVLFVQPRIGRGNRLFNLLKFRSMRMETNDPAGASSASRDDQRVTRIGRFIRSTSMDELPQLINVLRGDMSIVGPRPHALGSTANEKLFWQVDSTYWRRHSLRPGLTGLAQVRGLRGSTEREQDLTDRLQSDLEYIKDWSLRRDIGIALRTLSVLRHDKAF